ncbi:MAG: hypothetical protein F6K56_12080 [Moorea sp. SIO3G5]|nr:hypothetical protein [Moorena sp. SIO3G5]
MVEAIQKEENADLAKKWSKLLEEGTNKMAYDILSVPTEDRESVIDQHYNPEGRLRKKVSVERAYNEVKAERLIDAELESSGNSNDASGEAVDGETNDSDMGKCMQRASKEIVEGYTKTAIYLCDSGVLFNKKTQNIIDQHEMSIAFLAVMRYIII